jgi:hypothetical protein
MGLLTPFRMFPLFFFRLGLSLVVPSPELFLIALAIGHRASPHLSTSRPLSRLDTTFIRCFHSGCQTLSHTTLRGLSPAGLNFGLFTLFPPTFPLSAQRTLYRHGLGLNHTSKPDNCGPISPLSFACVSGQLRPSSRVRFLLSLRFPVSLAVRSDFRHRHSLQQSLRTRGSASSSLLAPASEPRAASPRRHIPAAAGITSHGTRTSPGFINFISFAPLSNSRADSIPAIYG